MASGDHAWGLMQTAPNSMLPDSVGLSHIKVNDPGLQTVAGGQYSYRPRTPTRPIANTVPSPNLHLRKTSAYAQSPRSYIVTTRRAGSPRTRHGNARPVAGPVEQQEINPQTTGGTRIPVEHYINVMRDSVHRLGHTADPIIDQLCFTSRRAQLDALFSLCPSIDFVDGSKVIAYLGSHAGEIQHLRTLSKGHSVIPADHIREPQVANAQSNHIIKKVSMRNKSSLPTTMSAPSTGVSGPNAKPAKPMSARYRQEEAHTRTHAPVLEYGKNARIKNKTDVQTIFEDLEKQNTKVVVVGK